MAAFQIATRPRLPDTPQNMATSPVTPAKRHTALVGKWPGKNGSLSMGVLTVIRKSIVEKWLAINGFVNLAVTMGAIVGEK